MPPQAYTHPPSTHAYLLALLSPLLPVCLPIYRRIESLSRHSSPSSTVLATFPSTTGTLPAAFAVAIFDPTSADGIHGFVFSTLELFPPDVEHGATTSQSDTHLLVILRGIRAHDSALATPPTPNDPTKIVLLGSTHAAVVAALHRLAVVHNAVGPGGPFTKLLFAPSPPQNEDAASAPSLPAELEWSTARDADYPAVMASNTYVRGAASLAQYRSAVVRERATGDAVGWVFEGLDGSMRTLCVVEKWRRRGVARMLMQRLREGMGDGWAHADVAGENRASLALMEALGGTRAWEVWWKRVDLGRVQ